VSAGKSGGGALKAIELTAGDLLHVVDSRLKRERFFLNVQQKSAEGIVGHVVGKANERQVGGATQGCKAAEEPASPHFSPATELGGKGVVIGAMAAVLSAGTGGWGYFGLKKGIVLA
jgi:hypothetical protein